MRLTLPLCVNNSRWIFKQMWKQKGKIKDTELTLNKAIFEHLKQGAAVVNATDAISPPLPKEPRWSPPVPDDPRFSGFFEKPKKEDHADYHKEPVYQFSNRTRLLEGEKQACILSKSQSFHGLPEKITDLVGVAEIPDQDELMQRYIMQAHIWDPSKEKLPRRLNKCLPGWKFKSEVGIPKSRIVDITIKNLLRLCHMLSGQYPEIFQNRYHINKHHYSTIHRIHGDRAIQIAGENDYIVLANSPLEPFASDDMLDESVTYTLPDIFPIAPTIDLKPVNIYKTDVVTGWTKEVSHSYPHTLWIREQRTWKPEERNARALMLCLSRALAYAHQKYGADLNITSLPEPISTQCISTDGARFDFMCFQLNTLNFESSDGVKNMAWFDNDNVMFNKILPERAMLRNTRYEDYDPDVLKKILAIYMNGLHI